MQASHPLQIRWHRALDEVDRTQWDRLAEPLSTPLLEWRWLHLMEASGSITPRSRWHPRHLTVWQGDRLVGAAPLYIKAHSEGEFVFDQWWARQASRAGIAYYPKLVGMSPVTPSVGYRFLVDPTVDGGRVQDIMLDAMDALCIQTGLSGCHLLFVDPHWQARLPVGRFLDWRHQSYLWRNERFTTFADYLARFKSSQRRNIRRERRHMAERGIVFRALTGESLDGGLARRMYTFYVNTNDQYGPWGCRYLTADFFEALFARYRDRLLVIAAEAPRHAEGPAALALLLYKKGHLIGRYWGCAAAIKDLHFSMCFYEPIRWAIAHGIRTFDPGAGSPHKIMRGFEAVPNTSLHRFHEPRLAALFGHLIGRVNQAEQENIDALNAMLPFARS